MNTEKVKVGLLGLIALLLLVNTYFLATQENGRVVTTTSVAGNVQSNIPQGNLTAPANNQMQNINATQTNDPTKNALPNAVTTPAGPTTNIKFASDKVDFGKVIPQSENKHSFEFVNTGNEPLTIENAKGSCGCTVPQWPKEPIMPGEKGTIDVVFRPKDREASGEDKKTVTVTANTNPKNTILTVSAFVEVNK